MRPSEWIACRMEKRYKEHEEKRSADKMVPMVSIQEFWILAIMEWLDEQAR